MDHDLKNFDQNALLCEIQYERDESWTAALKGTIMMIFNHVEPGLTFPPPSLRREHHPHQQNILQLLFIHVNILHVHIGIIHQLIAFP